jgi:tetratricopeptide (TPR) repeat protein
MTSPAPQNQIRRLLEQAAAQRSNGQWSQAVETYSQIIKLAPMFAPAYVERGLLIHEMGDPEKAFHDFENAIKLDGQYGPAYYGRGWVKHTRGDFDGEMQDAKKGLLLDRQSAGMYYRRIGAAYQGLDQYQEAIEAYNNAIEFYEGKDEGTIYNRGLCYMEINDYASAQTDFNRCLELDPDWAWAFAARAKTWLAMDNCEKAIADCSQAITFQPDYIYSYLWRAIAYETVGDKKRAAKDFEIVVKNTNSEQLKSIAKKHLKELKGGWSLFGS